MKGFDTLKVKSAVKSHNKFDLSRAHLTTMNFGEIVPLMVEETVPGDKFNVDAHYFSRMAPLAKPTYGKFSFKTVAGFVPYHQIAWDSDAFLAGKTTWEGITPVGRFFTLEGLSYFYRNFCINTGVTPTSGNCDISWKDTNGNEVYGVFSKEGKYYNKILNSLGYCFPQNTNLKSGSAWKTRLSSIKVSAYPLLAFAKLYNDYMSQSQRFNTSSLSSVLQSIKYGKQFTGFSPTSGVIDSAVLASILQSIKLSYENDYFTSAWQTPNAPAGTSEGITQVGVPSTTRSDRLLWDNDANGLQTTVNTGSPATVSITQRAMDFLKSFDDWVRRNNYSGSRAVQQVYSRFGIKTDDYRSHYAQVITTDTMPVQVGDITATAAEPGPGSPGINATNILGAYAGKGIVSDGKSVSCAVSDYGLFIILGYFTVAPMNSFGFDRRVLRNQPLDWYNPEFDGLGADAIPLFEIYENPRGAAEGDTTFSDSVFGFTERYNSYRYGRDMITGEFRDFVNSNTSAAGMNVWHSGRFLGDIRKAGNLVAQSTSMNTLPQVDSEYNRIFTYTGGDADHFYLTCQFKVDAMRPMLNLNQVPRLGEGDTIVPKNGNVIS